MINISIGALIFAIWLITLFFGKTIGLSMLLFAVPMTYFLIYILEKNNKIKNSKAKILIIPITLLSSTYFIYDNSFFNSLNIIIIPVLTILMILGLMGEKFDLNIGLLGKIIGTCLTPISFIGEAFEKFIESIEEKLKIDIDVKKEKKAKKIIKAILITLPIVVIIIILLSSADEVFASVFSNILKDLINFISKINISVAFVKIILIAIAFVYFISFFFYINFKFETEIELDEKNKNIKENFTIKMILGALNVIYLVFCYIQIKSLFMRSTTLNYAHYARQGFFQLMAVSLINLITILIANKNENKEEIKSKKYINIMSIIMIVFTFIIVISATLRMYFYERAYGYTLLRLLVYCALFTESVLFIPTILYILGKKINLAKTYFTIVIVIYICMNFANFDNIIAQRNVNRYIETGKIDMYYLKSNTGTDAVNQIIRLLETSTDVDDVKENTEEYLEDLYRKLDEENMDFRDFNISRIFAKHLIEKRLQCGNTELYKAETSAGMNILDFLMD